MRGPIEFEKLFQTRLKYWNTEIKKRKINSRKRHPQLSDNYFEEMFISRIKLRKGRLIGIMDPNHKYQDGFRRNNFLGDLFALTLEAPEKYRINPFGNFFQTDFPRIKKKHLNNYKTHPQWYQYRNKAFFWTVDETVNWCALFFAYNEILFPKEPNNVNISMQSAVREKSGYLNSKELASLLGKSPATISRWLKESQDIPHLRVNGRAMFKKDEIDTWINNKLEI